MPVFAILNIITHPSKGYSASFILSVIIRHKCSAKIASLNFLYHVNAGVYVAVLLV